MMSRKDGGSVYPIVTDKDPCVTVHSEGMSLRDYFAGQALAGILGGPSSIWISLTEISASAYKTADAMLKEREK